MAAYTFEPVYPVQEAVALAQRIRQDPNDYLTHGKHVAGIIGCVLEKHDADAPTSPAADMKYLNKARIQELKEHKDINQLAKWLEEHLTISAPAHEGDVAAVRQEIGFLGWRLIKAIAELIFDRIFNEE